MNNLIIREAENADVSAILELYQQPDMDNGKAISIEKASRILDRLDTYPFYKFFVATQHIDIQEDIVGVYGLLIMDNLGHQGMPSAIIEGVCVKQSMHGKGIGKAMMREAESFCREFGCYKLSLASNSKRKQAHQFYQSLGFKQHGISFDLEL
jgi:GNAT superfamily N-acetyltransferase